MLATLIRRAGGIAAGIAIGQGVVLLVTPYLARHYSPAAFGALALLMTVSNLSTAVACLRYDLAIPSSSESESRGLLITALIVSSSMAVLAAAVIATLENSRLVAFAGSLAHEPFLVGTCILLVGFHQATSAWLLRRGSYRGVAGMRLSQGVGFSILAIIPGVGLLWAHALSFVGGLIGLRPALRHKRPTEIPWYTALWSNRQFPALNLPGSILDVCGYSLCIWVIATYYGQSTAGSYSQIQRLTGAPLMLVSISLGQILLRQTAELNDGGDNLRLFLIRILKMMMLLAGVALIGLWVLGQQFFASLLGPQWHIGRELIMFVAIAVFFRACISPLSTVLITLRRFKVALGWQVLYFSSALLLMPYFARHLTFDRFIAFYAIHESVHYSFYLFLIYRASGCQSKSLTVESI